MGFPLGAIGEAIDLYWFLSIFIKTIGFLYFYRIFDDRGNFYPKMLHFLVLNPVGPELEIKLFVIGRS